LIAEDELVLKSPLLQDLMYAGSHFLRVGVAPVDDGKGEGVGAEKKKYIVPFLLWKQIQALYDSAKKAGDIDAESVTEWLKSDYESMGDWEYRVIQVTSKDSSVLEGELNLAGTERWEVFWVREGSGNFTFFLKRPQRSYLRSIPLSDLLKLIPGGGGE